MSLPHSASMSTLSIAILLSLLLLSPFSFFSSPPSSSSPSFPSLLSLPSVVADDVDDSVGTDYHFSHLQKQAFLDLFNQARANTFPPAGNMAALIWDEGLASRAAGISAACDFTTVSANNFLFYRGNRTVNTIQVGLGAPFNSWQASGSFYNYDANTCSAPAPRLCYDYKMIVSAQEQYVGCAVYLCQGPAGGLWDFFTCVFDTSIDGGGQPYGADIQCSNCPAMDPLCWRVGENGQLCVPVSGLTAVGNQPSFSVYDRRLTGIGEYVLIGVGGLVGIFLIWYGVQVRKLWMSGETRTSFDGEDYLFVGPNSSSSSSAAAGGSTTTGNGSSGAPSLPSSKPGLSVNASAAELAPLSPSRAPPSPRGTPGGKSAPSPRGPSLPPNWQEHKDDSGYTYYYNTVTGASQWELPK